MADFICKIKENEATRSLKQQLSTLMLRSLILLVGLQPLLQSCNTTKYLDREKGEKYLVENSIEFADKARKKSNLSYELSQLYKQRPNGKFFGVPRPYFYFTAQDTIDKSKLGKAFARFQGRIWGEEPVYLDTILAQKTSEAMVSHLRNRGYFFAEVKDTVSTNRKQTKSTVTYRVKTGGQFTVDTIKFISKDTAIQRQMNEIAKQSFFKSGSPIDIQLYEQEVSRITRHLRNNGYAYFYPQYISNLEATDSSNSDRNAVLELEVLPPAGSQKHQAFRVGNIYLNPNFNPSTLAMPTPDTLIGGIFFVSGGEGFKVKPRTLVNSITFSSGEKFDQSKLDNTVRQLGALGVFRPPTVRFEEDSLHTGVLNFYVLLTPNKKWEVGLDFDISNTSGNSVGLNSNLIGLTVSPSIRNRNFLRGAELMVGNTDFGVELAPFGGNRTINSLDFRLQADLYFPRFVDYFGLWRGLLKRRKGNDKFYQKLRQKANSRFSSSYNYLELIQNYKLHFVNLSYGYDVPLNQTDLLSINHFGIDLLIPNIDRPSRFGDLLDENPFLENSFKPQFITGFLFRDITYTYTSKTSDNTYWFLRSYFDISGLEVMGVNALYNSLTGNSDRFRIGETDFSHYLKVELDGRHYWNYGPNRSLVARISTGVTRPYYRSDEVPYVKQFFVGGPNSIRGWYARSLGPGLYQDDLFDSPSAGNLYYQSADLKLEFNLEYRFFMTRPFGLFNLYGALFLDGGNIWTVGEDEDRPGSQFTVTRLTDPQTGEIVADNFLRAMALSGGFGTRWDFTYFIFRVDLGTPLRNNYPDLKRNNTYLTDLSKWQMRDIVLNIGLGYPF